MDTDNHRRFSPSGVLETVRTDAPTARPDDLRGLDGLPRASGPGLDPSRQADAVVLVRRARADDAEAVWAVETATFRESERFGPDQAARLVANPRARVLVAELVAEVGGGMGGVVGGGVVGWAAMLIRRHRNGRSGRLYTIAVLPGFAGRGLGRRLATETLALIAGEGVGRVFLEVREDNAPAIALYESLGFRTVARLPGYYGELGPGLRMRRDASRPASAHLVAPMHAARGVTP